MIHGKVEINDKPIIGWQAIRSLGEMRETESGYVEYRYACEVYDYEDKSTVRFTVYHCPVDGAAELVQKIWAQFTEI